MKSYPPCPTLMGYVEGAWPPPVPLDETGERPAAREPCGLCGLVPAEGKRHYCSGGVEQLPLCTCQVCGRSFIPKRRTSSLTVCGIRCATRRGMHRNWEVRP